MRTSALLALGGACLQATHAAIQFPLTKQKVSRAEASFGSKSRSITSSLSYQDTTYVVNVTVGTPGQPVSLELSTISADTWVIDSRSEYCNATTYTEDSDYVSVNLCTRGTFSPGLSASFRLNDTTTSDEDDGYSYEDYDTFGPTTGGGGYAYGQYMTDVLTFGDVSISNLTMGLGNVSYADSEYLTTYMGVLGIGYNQTVYDNLPDRLQKQGSINSTAYSIWVNDEAGSSGSLLFGAVDTTKYDGELVRLQSQYSSYTMIVDVVGINGTTASGTTVITDASDEDSESGYTSGQSSDGVYFDAVLSPSDSVSVVPTDIASQIWSIAGAYYHEDLYQAVISCTASDDGATNFTIGLGGSESRLGGPVISATLGDLIIPSSEINLTEAFSDYYYASENDTDIGDLCLFGVQNDTSLTTYYSYTLGSTLLRRTYTVFDLVNNEVAVAAVKFGATETSNIVPFTSYGATVPSSTMYCTSYYCYDDSGSDSSTEGPGSGGGGGETQGLSGVLPFGALIGMSLGIAFGCLALGLVLFFVWRHRRNKSMAEKEAGSASGAEAGEATPAMSSANAPMTITQGMTDDSRAAAVSSVDKGKEPESLGSAQQHPAEGEQGGSSAPETRHGRAI